MSVRCRAFGLEVDGRGRPAANSNPTANSGRSPDKLLERAGVTPYDSMTPLLCYYHTQ